jgi:hypothetical protein
MLIFTRPARCGAFTPNRTTENKDMRKTLSTYEIADLLIEDDNAFWSRSGAFALAEYLEDIEAVTGQEMDFDAVAIRCEWAEYSSLQDWGEDYFGGWNQLCAEFGDDYCGPSEGETPEEYAERFDDAIRAHIHDNGTLIEFDGGIIVSSF